MTVCSVARFAVCESLGLSAYRSVSIYRMKSLNARVVFVGLFALVSMPHWQDVHAAPGAPLDVVEHIARTGDTLNGLATRLLTAGNTARVQRALQQYNRQFPDPNRIYPGQIVRFPRAWLKGQPRPVTFEVAAVQGDVQSGGAPLAMHAELNAGDDVETGADGYVTLKLKDGSTLTVMPLTVAKVKRAQIDAQGVPDTAVEVTRGRTETSVRKPPRGAARFEVKTPVANMAVRGTLFRVTTDQVKGTDTTEVIAGIVAVNDAGNFGKTEVSAGFGTQVTAGAAPLAPRPLLPAPAIWEGVRLVERLPVELPFNALTGAVSYRLSLAANERFTPVLQEQILRDPVLRLGQLADGSYFLRVRGIDDIGLEGRDTTLRMKVRVRAASPDPINPPDNAKSRESTLEFTWIPSVDAAGYIFQLARDSQFVDRVGDWPNLTEVRHRVPDLPPGSYYWRVAAQLGKKQSLWSEARRVDVVPPPAVSATIEVPQAISPAECLVMSSAGICATYSPQH
jgi:hypothetical protein